MRKAEGIRWKAVVYERTTPDGKQIQRTKTGRSPTITQAKKDKEAARVQLRKEIEADGAWVGTMKELGADWLRIMGADREISTNYAESLKVKRIVEGIGHIQLTNLTARHLDNWYHTLLVGDADHKPLSITSVRQYHTLVKAMLEKAFKWNMVPGNIAAKATPPKKPRGAANAHHKTLTPEALRAVIDACRPSLKLCAQLAVATGCRRGEILALRWSSLNGRQLSVDLSLTKVPGKKLTAKAPKSGLTRELTLPAEILPILAAHRQAMADYATAAGVDLAADGPIVADQRADPTGRTPYDPKWLTQAWANHCKRQGVQFRFHDCRHLHASQLIGSGIDPAAAAARLGHSSAKMTLDTYSKALTQNDDKAAAVIGELMFRST